MISRKNTASRSDQLPAKSGCVCSQAFRGRASRNAATAR